MPPLLETWARLSCLPGGRTLFTRLVCLKAPYFASIKPLVSALDAEHCEVRIKKRRAVTNHLGTVHAIAMCNMAELAGGLLTDAVVPARTHRWIPKGMSVEYLKKAGSDLVATARLDGVLDLSSASALPVEVTVHDATGNTVFRARIAMWVSPKK